MEQKHIISVLVANKSGALTRISGLFARRSYNIDSLSVCATEDKQLSRMTITSIADENTMQQIIKQLSKLYDVRKVTELDRETSVARELLLVKVRMPAERRPEIESTCHIYKAKLIDLSPASVILELTGEPNKIDGFLKVVSPYGIIEMTRTGLSALERGQTSINDLADYNETL